MPIDKRTRGRSGLAVPDPDPRRDQVLAGHTRSVRLPTRDGERRAAERARYLRSTRSAVGSMTMPMDNKTTALVTALSPDPRSESPPPIRSSRVTRVRSGFRPRVSSSSMTNRTSTTAKVEASACAARITPSTSPAPSRRRARRPRRGSQRAARSRARTSWSRS